MNPQWLFILKKTHTTKFKTKFGLKNESDLLDKMHKSLKILKPYLLI